jgi:TPR repeat protein
MNIMNNGNTLLNAALKEMKKERPDLKVVYELLNKAAKKNNGEALYAIGTWYLFGRHVKKNPHEAVIYFLKAAEQNNSDAFFDLGICYEKGTGIKKNNKAAFRCYLNAALLGDKQALYEIGRCFYYGIGISKNITVAQIWLKHAKTHRIG